MQFSSKNILQEVLFTLCLTMGVHTLKVEVRTSTINVGDDLEIECSEFSITTTASRLSINYTTTIIWQYENRESLIPDEYMGRIHSTSKSGYINDVTITLTNVTRADHGFYLCELEQDDEKKSSTQVTVEVYAPPRFMQVSLSPSPPYNQNTQCNVSCRFSVFPATVKTNLYNMKIMKGSSTYTVGMSNGPSFRAPLNESTSLIDVQLHSSFMVAKKDNGKLVTCEVTWKKTKRSTAFTYTASAESPLNVTFQELSTINIDSSPKSPLSEGDVLTTTCTSQNANPPIVIGWKIGSKNVTEGVEVKHEPGENNGKITNSTLRVKVSREMNGINIQCCGDECVNSSSSVNVLFPPTTNIRTVDVLYHENGTIGSIINITCVTDTSNPEAKIVWDIGGEEVNSLNTNIEEEHGGTHTTSFYSFEIMEENFTQPITCSVIWKGALFVALNRSYVLGDELTTVVPSESTSTITYPYMAGVTEEEQRQTTAGLIVDAAQASTAANPLTTAVIIGIALGVGCGVLLVTVIILVVVLVRRRKVRSNDIDAKDTDQEKRLSAHVYDDIDEASGDGNVSKQDHLDGLYDEIQQDNSNTQLPKDKLKDKPATTTNGPVTSLPTTAPTPSLDSPDTNGVVYAVVSKPVKTPTASAPEAQKSKANSSSSVPDTDVPEESKAIKVSSAKGSPPDLNTHKMDKSVNEKKETAREKEAHSPGAVSGKEPVAVTSESNKKKGKPKKPPKKPKPSTGKSQEKPKEKPALSKKKGSKSNDESIQSDENVYYNTLDVVLNGSSPDPKESVPDRPQKRTENKNKSSKVEDTPREYYNTRDEILHKPPVIDDAYCEISTEPPSNVVKDHGADYAEVSDNLDTSARSVSSKHRSSYHTVDFAQSDGGDDDGDSGGEDIDSD